MRQYLFFALAGLSVSTFAATNPFEYTAAIPYVGGLTINVINTTANAQPLSNITFTGNSTIDTSSNANCWGSAITYQSVLSGANGTYTLSNAASPVNVPANASVTLSCSTTSTILPPLTYAMLPSSVTINDTPAIYQPISTQDPGNGYQLVGYLGSWDFYPEPKNPGYEPSMIPVTKINTIVYAFEGFGADGTVFPDDAYADSQLLPQLEQIKLQYPYMRILVGFGGWQNNQNDPNSPPWSEMAADPAAEQAFVKNSVAFMQAVNADGLNIDWEYPVMRERPSGSNPSPVPAAQDAQDYAKLITDLRQALDTAGAATGKHYLLTIAGPAGDQDIAGIEAAYPGVWQTVANNVDYNYLMTYDFYGQFNYDPNPTQGNPSDSDFLSGLTDNPADPSNATFNGYGKQFDVEDAVNDMLVYFKPSQMVIGIPLYGRLESITYSNNDGVFNHLADSSNNGEWGGPTMYDYRCIIDTSLCNAGAPSPFPVLNYVPASANPYAETPSAYSNNYFITYDDENSMATKANWIVAQHLGGAMFWDLSGDVRPSDEPSKPNFYTQKSVINAAQAVFDPPANK